MDLTDIAGCRLRHQRLAGAPLPSAADVVRWLGAVQAQDYAGAKWALAQRAGDLTNTALDRLFDAGTILRTHVLRPTWHFVVPEDAHWLLQLTGPRLRASLRGRHRQLELSDRDIALAANVMSEALGGGRSLTRAELGSILREAGVASDGQRLPHLLLCAEVDAVIISGPLRDKQFTWALFEDRAPKSRKLDRDEAAARLVHRYFQSHGPALVEDFTWWSGLTLRETRRAIAAVGPALSARDMGGKQYWLASSSSGVSGAASSPVGHLLPNWDEYTVAYRDRSAAVRSADAERILGLPFGSILGNVVTVDGNVRGSWTRRIGHANVEVLVQPFGTLSASEVQAVHAAAQRFGRFLERPAQVQIEAPT